MTTALAPERRQRILHAQELHQRGHSLRQIADVLQVSHATVHADLQLFNDAFPQIAQTLAHEHTFERLEYIAQQLRLLAADDPLEPLLKYAQLKDERAVPLIGQVTANDIVRLYGQHRSVMIALLREHRLAAARLEAAALTRREPAEQLPQPTNHSLNTAEHSLTELTESDHLAPPRPDSEPAPQPADHPDPANHPEPPNQSLPQPAAQPQPTPRLSRAQRRRAEALARKAQKKRLRKQRAPAAA